MPNKQGQAYVDVLWSMCCAAVPMTVLLFFHQWDLSGAQIWKEVHPAVWEGSWEQVMEPQVREAVAAICQQQPMQPSQPERAIEYRFRMAP